MSPRLGAIPSIISPGHGQVRRSRVKSGAVGVGGGISCERAVPSIISPGQRVVPPLPPSMCALRGGGPMGHAPEAGQSRSSHSFGPAGLVPHTLVGGTTVGYGPPAARHEPSAAGYAPTTTGRTPAAIGHMPSAEEHAHTPVGYAPLGTPQRRLGPHQPPLLVAVLVLVAENGGGVTAIMWTKVVRWSEWLADWTSHVTRGAHSGTGHTTSAPRTRTAPPWPTHMFVSALLAFCPRTNDRRR